MGKIIMVIGLFFGVVVFFRMRNERIESEANMKENTEDDKEEIKG